MSYCFKGFDRNISQSKRIFKSLVASFDTYYKSTLEANLEAVEAVETQKKTKNTKKEKVLSALGFEPGTPGMASRCANHYTNVSMIHKLLFNEYLNRLLLHLTLTIRVHWRPTSRL